MCNVTSTWVPAIGILQIVKTKNEVRMKTEQTKLGKVNQVFPVSNFAKQGHLNIKMKPPPPPPWNSYYALAERVPFLAAPQDHLCPVCPKILIQLPEMQPGLRCLDELPRWL